MGTKTIGLRDDVYDRLKARKQDGESFTELVNRLLDESTVEWRDGFGSLPEAEGEELERLVAESRERLDEGLSARQTRPLEALAGVDENGDKAA